MNVHLALRHCKGKDTAIGNVVTQGQCSAVSRQDRSAEGLSLIHILKNETTNLLNKEAKEFILEAEKYTALRAKPVCPAVFERNKMMEATQYESYFSS